MARFVVADLTDARSVLQELQEIVPGRPNLTIQPLLHESQDEGMWDHIRRFPWVLSPVRYADMETLLANLGNTVISPATAKARELMET